MATAYKKLLVLHTPKGVFGVSPSQTTIWLPHKETGMPCHQARNWNGDFAATGAGVYCLKNPNDKELDNYAGDLVEMWVSGTIAPYSRGYRAEKAKVIRVVQYSFDLQNFNMWGRGKDAQFIGYLKPFFEERKEMKMIKVMQRHIDGNQDDFTRSLMESPKSWDDDARAFYRDHFGEDDLYVESLALNTVDEFFEFCRRYEGNIPNFARHVATWISWQKKATASILMGKVFPHVMEEIATDPELTKIALGGE